jgi:hypothetical protein
MLKKTENTASLVGLKTIPNYTPLYNKDMEDEFYADGLIKSNNQHPYWMKFESADARILSLYGVRFLVSIGEIGLREKDKIDWTERPDLSWLIYRVWENKYYIGRAYVLTSGDKRISHVEFIEDNPASVILGADTQEDGRLLLADLNYPGWEAYVDGKNVPTEVYHGCLRSVKLLKGKHIVQWKYGGRTQRLGLILSMLALFSLVCFLFVISVFKKPFK